MYKKYDELHQKWKNIVAMKYYILETYNFFVNGMNIGYLHIIPCMAGSAELFVTLAVSINFSL